MSKTFNQNYPIYDVSYGHDIPSEQLFLVYFDTLPSIYTITSKVFTHEIIDYFISNGFVTELKLNNVNRKKEMTNDVLLINKEKKTLIQLESTPSSDDEHLFNVKILYSIKHGDINSFFKVEEFQKFEKEKSKSNISLIRSDMGHLDTEEYNLEIPEINIELNYGSEFLNVHEVIVEKLNRPNGKGIILLHGDPGTGKTSYIKYLTSLIKDKDILFIPPSMAEMLSEPSIIPFLMDRKNSILVIEDAERVIADREGNGSPAGVSNILNLTDGILGDCLNIQILATFNMRREKIDSALLRKGRLIAEHKFENLSIEETNKLLKHLNKTHTSKEPMSLADIYNIDLEVHKTKNKSKIGLY